MQHHTLIDTTSKSCVIVFLKEPRAGHVKTRLAASMPKEYINPSKFASDIYAACLKDLFKTLNSLHTNILPYLTATCSSAFLSDLTSTSPVIQKGDDLGEKMYHAFVREFHNFDKIVLIGSDLPNLNSQTLLSAFNYLDSNDCVIGPAEDGGYYLIGFSKLGFTNCFRNIKWSTQTVLAETLNMLSGKKYVLLETMNDLDTWSDLVKNFDKYGSCSNLKNLFRNKPASI